MSLRGDHTAAFPDRTVAGDVREMPEGRRPVSTVDLFAGPGGWDEAAATLGLRPLGIELDAAACATRAAAGHLTVRADVSERSAA